MKYPDRFSISKNYANELRDKNSLISSFFERGNNFTQKEKCLYAMALGLKSPSKIETKDAIFNSRELTETDEILIALASINEEEHFDLDILLDENRIYEFAQNCVNSGLEYIIDLMKGNTENLEKKLLFELDNEFNKISDILDEIKV